MKKRIIALVAAVLCAAVLIAAFWRTPEKRTLRWLDRNRAELTETAAAACAGAPMRDAGRVTAHYWDGEHPIVEYVVVSRGIVSASTYCGVFYSPDGVPVSFQNSGETLSPVSDTEWTWQGDGDNHGAVRALGGGWFYFEASL